MNIRKILLSALSLAVSLGCALSPSRGGRVAAYDLSSALEVKSRIVGGLDCFEEGNNGTVFVVSGASTDEVGMGGGADGGRMLVMMPGVAKKGTVGVKTAVSLKCDFAKDAMVADIRQTAPKAEIGDVSYYGGVETGGAKTEGDDVVLVDETVQLTPKIVRHEGDDEIYILYKGQEYNLEEFVEMAESRSGSDPNALEVAMVDDLAVAAILAIAALIFSLPVTAGEIGVSTQRVPAASSEGITWYEVVGVVLLWPFMILSGDSPSADYQEVQVFDPSQT